MKLIRKITERIARRNPIEYARKIGVKVGNECRFTGNPRWGSEPWLIQVENHVLLSAEVNFVTHDAGTFLFRDTEEYKDVFKFAPIVIHDNCFIGMRSTLLPGIEIGPKCHLITPEGCVWYYGVAWEKLRNDYFAYYRSSTAIDDIEGSPYYGRTKQFVNIK